MAVISAVGCDYLNRSRSLKSQFFWLLDCLLRKFHCVVISCLVIRTRDEDHGQTIVGFSSLNVQLVCYDSDKISWCNCCFVDC